jgi:hypothetical protein
VKAARHTFGHAECRVWIRDVAHAQIGPGRQIGAAAGRKVVQYAYFVTPRRQRIAKVRTDEASAACHKVKTHARDRRPSRDNTRSASPTLIRIVVCSARPAGTPKERPARRF